MEVCPYGAPHLAAAADAEARAALLIEASLGLVREALRGGSFCLTLLGIGATNFEPANRLAATFKSSGASLSFRRGGAGVRTVAARLR